MDLKVYPDLKYLSSVKGYGPLAGELEENHHDDDDEKGVEHLDDNDDNKIVKIVMKVKNLLMGLLMVMTRKRWITGRCSSSWNLNSSSCSSSSSSSSSESRWFIAVTLFP